MSETLYVKRRLRDRGIQRWILASQMHAGRHVEGPPTARSRLTPGYEIFSASVKLTRRPVKRGKASDACVVCNLRGFARISVVNGPVEL